ncbi:UDP-galactose transporter HUT1 [Kluyveromyces lactis]|uniref:UDP-galactose transporter homolog 1 n=1 Tax=Kluyveromyces lactis (strain ATCC 8585 / CBS 2359 / DSM 70799 / NBRC 1267 / NRRL Y-1140 / WM37) TaxID=284590 RepID=HUT1_KLULA|nr:uncharacterized protein KLLA0_D12848g [Kluyveromyces lactis]Q6CR04.1 RecName: Full=UDP-galactose transporter homolog 1 [Kluyveromyces lactis NRRL Y-1140]CAH00731.1 KLLA0D12848p [Kluyveromyces lactis]|eukprot:XP_453635.1 uncharacterized protein KLLA0_D12848g [Kluyveromyces lactis]
MGRHILKHVFAVGGIYCSFLTWGLLQEPLNTRVWPNSGCTFQVPYIVALVQATIAMICGLIYIKWQKPVLSLSKFWTSHTRDMAIISLSQAISAPLAAYSLSYVDFLTYMLAKSCKLLPVLMVHLIVYRTPIPRSKKLVVLLVTVGITIFTLDGHKPSMTENDVSESSSSSSLIGFVLLGSSLFLDGLTNAKQDKLFQKATYKITGAHLMFALNFFLIVWNVIYMVLVDRQQLAKGLKMLHADPEISRYLLAYACCGAIGQCFIFYTLEQYGSLVLVMVTVTRKMFSMILSIIVYGHQVTLWQWVGIVIVFTGVVCESMGKKNKAKEGNIINEEKVKQS